MALVTPAYGRDYKSADEAKKAFLSGSDFIGDVMTGFRLCSCRDFKGQIVEIRYNKLRMFTTVEVPK